MTVVDRFLNYIKFDTQSDELTNLTPSTPGQMEFARYLQDQLSQMGLSDITLDDNGYLMATLPSNLPDGRRVPTVGFIAHLDTSPDMSGHNVSARIVKDYDGGDIKLNADVTLSPSQFPELKHYVGQDLIVTDGTTLLGADDKAGIAEVVSAIAYLQAHPEIEHGDIRIAFNPDEEIGKGAHKFDVKRFGADWAYTMDGGEIGEMEYENFNAAAAHVTFTGLNVHPGYAKGKMVNSIRVAVKFASMLPDDETPEATEGYQGFFHLVHIQGSVEKTEMTYIIRDFDRQNFEARKQRMQQIADTLNKEYPGCVEVELSDQYYNMREKIEPVQHIIDIALRAMKEVGITTRVVPIRGGTDGAQLSFKGLPCPNIFAGGLNFHGRYEFVPIPSMEKATMTIVEICRIVAE